jgi:hypothetical protein
MQNTGYKSFETLEKYFTDDGSSTGETKSNVVTDPDYIAPVQNFAECPPTDRYYNTIQAKTVTKNNCGTGYTGSSVTLTAYPNQFFSNESLTDANNKALTWLENSAQSYANIKGTCTVDSTLPILLVLKAAKSVIFQKSASSWSGCKNASSADLQLTINNFIGGATNGSQFYLSRYRGVIDTSSIITKPKSAKIKFRFSENTVGGALTFNLYGANVQIPVNQDFQSGDWDDWDSSTFINSVSVPSNSTNENEITLTSSQLDLLHSQQAFNFFLISNGDRNNNDPITNNRPTLSIANATGEVFLEYES